MGKRILACLFALLLLGGVALAEGDINSKAMLNAPGRRIGISQGSAAEEAVASEFPKATIVHYTDNLLGYTAVAQGKLDAYVYDLVQMQLTIDNGMTGVHLLPEVMDETVKIAFGYSDVSGIPDLRDKLNRFIAEIKADGTLDDMYRRWVIDGNSAMPEIPKPDSPRVHLTVGTTGTVPPYSYYEGRGLTGFDIELAHRFAAWLGADLSLRVYDFDGIVPAAKSGKIDVIMSNLQYLPERSGGLSFSDILYEEKMGIMVRGDVEYADGEMSADAGDAYADYNGERLAVPTGRYDSLSDLSGARIGVQTGTSFDKAVFELLPDAEVSYFNTKADLVNALLSNKIDAYAVDEPVIKAQMQQDDRLTYIPEYMDRFDFAYVFPKTYEGQSLCDQFSEYLRSIRSDGTMAKIEAKWFGEDDSQKTIADYRSFPAPNGTLRMATEAMYEPFSYIMNNKITGYDIDIVVHFCEVCGYGLNITDMSFDAVLLSVQSDKCDFGGTGITITDERRESVLFSEPNFSGGTVMAVLKADETAAAVSSGEAEDTSFWGGIKSSFHKTFIREGRWRLFVDGVRTTLLITALSILFGTLLGFMVFMMCRNGNPAANLVTRFCLWLVQGMPMVVLLMILYYVIFGSVAISGVFVAVIGFTLTFGAAVFGLLRMGVGAIDNGQYEAAYALGYSNRRTFFRIILPQALPHVLPAYRGEIVSLIKATAIVGYIAVQDLTKMGDIVRSRTYEAFFPLIAVTVIYFVLEGLIGFLVSRVSLGFNPKRRKPADILKGIKTGNQN